MMDEATRLGELIHDSLINHTGSARTMGSFRVAEDVLAAGYVRLEGIDVEALREAWESKAWTVNASTKEVKVREPKHLAVLLETARQVLAALDGEGEA